MKLQSAAIALTGALCAPAFASPILTFDPAVHGEIITNQFAGSHGITISANNLNRAFDLAVAFDSLETGTADPDLEGPPWLGGNLAPNTVLGNMLILQENNIGIGDGIADSPDDEAGRPAGDLIFDFATPQLLFGFDIIDVEGTMQENGMVSFFLGGGMVGLPIAFSDITNNLSSFYDASVAFGDHTANRLGPWTAGDIGAINFDRVVIRLGGSGAVDNIVIPAPGVGAIFLTAAGLTGIRRRR